MSNRHTQAFQGSQTSSASSFTLVNASDLFNLDLPPQEWVVDNLIGKEKVILLAADTGVGKSYFAQQLAIAIAAGLPEIIGFKIPKARRVFFINLEMSHVQMWERNRALLSGLDKSEILALESQLQYNNCKEGRHLFEDSWGRIEQTITENDPFDLIIVDNLYSSQTGDDEVNRDAKVLLAQIIKIAELKKSSILLIAHHKKHDSMHDYLEVNNIRGASTYANACDVIIQLAESNTEDGLRLFRITKNRDSSNNRNKTIGLQLDKDTSWIQNIGEVNPRVHFCNSVRINEQSYILDNLPKQFKTREFVRLYQDSGKKPRAAHNRINSLLEDRAIKKVEHGVYEKVE
jgi:RecA-family ATPase